MYSPTTNLDDSTNYDDFSTIVTTQSENIPLSNVLALDNSQIKLDDSPRIPQLAPPLISSAPATLNPSDKFLQENRIKNFGEYKMKMYNYHQTWAEFNIAFSLHERNKLKDDVETVFNPKLYPFSQGPPQQLSFQQQIEIYDAKFNDAIQKKQVYQSFNFSQVETRHWNQQPILTRIYPVKFDEKHEKMIKCQNSENFEGKL